MLHLHALVWPARVPAKNVRHHVQRAIKVLDQLCQRFRQTIESLLGNIKIIEDGLGWVRPPFSLMVQEQVLESARVTKEHPPDA